MVAVVFPLYAQFYCNPERIINNVMVEKFLCNHPARERSSDQIRQLRTKNLTISFFFWRLTYCIPIISHSMNRKNPMCPSLNRLTLSRAFFKSILYILFVECWKRESIEAHFIFYDIFAVLLFNYLQYKLYSKGEAAFLDSSASCMHWNMMNIRMLCTKLRKKPEPLNGFFSYISLHFNNSDKL